MFSTGIIDHERKKKLIKSWQNHVKKLILKRSYIGYGSVDYVKRETNRYRFVEDPKGSKCRYCKKNSYINSDLSNGCPSGRF